MSEEKKAFVPVSIRDAFTRKYLLDPLEEMLEITLKPERETHYLDACKRMTDSELRETFEWLRDNYEYSNKFPSPADIAKARKTCAALRPHRPGSNASRPAQPWEERERKQKDLLLNYMKRFTSFAIYQQAVAAGYDRQLLEYAKEVAFIQAQMIHPGPNGVAYNSGPLFGYDYMREPNWEANLKRWFGEQAQQASSGEIGISVPNDRINVWRNAKPLPAPAISIEKGVLYDKSAPVNTHISQHIPDLADVF